MFEVGPVVEKASSLLIAANNMPTEARKAYEEAILEWTDTYADSFHDASTTQAQGAKRAIARLWIEYSRLERSLRQWKQAVTVFENAVADDVVSDIADVWVEYANFYDKERQKPAKAQRVYIRALAAVTAHERPRVWNAFLQSMRQSAPDLTLEQLKEAVKDQYQEPPEEVVAAPSAFATNASVPAVKREAAPTQASTDAPPTKRPHTEVPPAHMGGEVAMSPPGVDASHGPQPPSVSPAERQARLTQFLANYPEKPPNLFTPLTADMPRLKDLHPADSAVIEKLFMCDREANVLSTPPRQTVFEIVEAMSMMQALKERTFDKWFADLQEHQQARGRAMHMEHQEREAKAMDVHRSEVRRLNKEEYDAYVHECGLEVKTLHALVWKEALGILHLQQRILSDVGLPHMTITTDSAAVAKQREIVQALQLAHGELKNEPVHSTAPAAAKALPRRAPASGGTAAVPKRVPHTAPASRMSGAGPVAAAGAGAAAARPNGHAAHVNDPRQVRHPTAQQAREVMAAAAAAATPTPAIAERTDGGVDTTQVNPEALPMLMKIAAILQQAKK